MKQPSNPSKINTTFRTRCSQYWQTLQSELLPMQAADFEGLTPTLERVIRVLEWVRIEEFVGGGAGFGRPQKERCSMARAYCVKAVLGFECTTELLDRLKVDRKLRRICGLSLWKMLPSEATFSRAFGEFAKDGLADKAHKALIQSALAGEILGAVSRDSTAITARERPVKIESAPKAPKIARKRGRPAKGEIREPVIEAPSRIQIQRTQTLEQIVADLPKYCAHGTKTNAKGYKESWSGYKLHLDTANCGVIVSALTTSASMHDSQACIPLSMMSSQRVTYLYELADAAYCSEELRAHSKQGNHIPLFDHNPRGGEKREFEPWHAHLYKDRTGAERANAELKDGRGLRQVWVQGHAKVHAHLMFAVLVLSADQLMRLLQ
jgi:Transposase DDE domain/Transposase domain (DUF772)